MGGRAAEELIFGADKVTGGASADFQGTTNIAEAMVKNLAMSDKLGMSKFLTFLDQISEIIFDFKKIVLGK